MVFDSFGQSALIESMNARDASRQRIATVHAVLSGAILRRAFEGLPKTAARYPETARGGNPRNRGTWCKSHAAPPTGGLHSKAASPDPATRFQSAARGRDGRLR
jgi:hypothetical protein